MQLFPQRRPDCRRRCGQPANDAIERRQKAAPGAEPAAATVCFGRRGTSEVMLTS